MEERFFPSSERVSFFNVFLTILTDVIPFEISKIWNVMDLFRHISWNRTGNYKFFSSLDVVSVF